MIKLSILGSRKVHQSKTKEFSAPVQVIILLFRYYQAKLYFRDCVANIFLICHDSDYTGFQFRLYHKAVFFSL